MAISLSDEEMTDLSGLPHLLICLYVMAIRPRMDFKTAMVGIAPRISWQALSEWLYVEPKQSRQNSGSAHKSTIRRAIDALIKAGLIERRGNAESLVFYLPKANKGKFVSKKADTKSTPQADTVNPMLALAVDNKADTPKTAKADTHQISDINYTTTTTDNTMRRVNCGGGDFIFPSWLSEAGRADALKVLECVPQAYWQTLLDELHGAQAMKPIANPVGYLRAMAQKLKAGEFTSEKAGQVLEHRQKRAASDAKAESQKRVLQKSVTRTAPTEKDLSLLPPGLRKKLSGTLGKGSASPAV